MSTVVEDKHTKSVNGLILFILSVKSDYPECYMETYHFLRSGVKLCNFPALLIDIAAASRKQELGDTIQLWHYLTYEITLKVPQVKMFAYLKRLMP